MPTHMFLGTLNFNSWEGRAPGHLKDGKSSREVIEDYASRETEIPGVDQGVDLFLGDEGEVFAYSHNAHRVAAARLKGQKAIDVQGPILVFHLALNHPDFAKE